MNHTIIIRPYADFVPHASGAVKHSVFVADDVSILTESTDYLRALHAALGARLAIADESGDFA